MITWTGDIGEPMPRHKIDSWIAAGAAWAAWAEWAVRSARPPTGAAPRRERSPDLGRSSGAVVESFRPRRRATIAPDRPPPFGPIVESVPPPGPAAAPEQRPPGGGR